MLILILPYFSYNLCQTHWIMCNSHSIYYGVVILLYHIFTPFSIVPRKIPSIWGKETENLGIKKFKKRGGRGNNAVMFNWKIYTSSSFIQFFQNFNVQYSGVKESWLLFTPEVYNTEPLLTIKEEMNSSEIKNQWWLNRKIGYFHLLTTETKKYEHNGMSHGPRTLECGYHNYHMLFECFVIQKSKRK